MKPALQAATTRFDRRRLLPCNAFPLANTFWPGQRLAKGRSQRTAQPINKGRTSMLSRRDFASVASCGLCSLTGFIATDASAQTPPAGGTPGVTRKVLSQTDGPTPGYV